MRNWKIILSICFILLIALIALFPCLQNDFVNLDDHLYVTENRLTMKPSLENIKTIFSRFHMGHYHPLTLLSFAVEFHFFKLNPLAYHATNLILHLLNSLLVFWLIVMLRGSLFTSLMVALLFSIHPLHVESVAWVSERKDLLYSFFFLGSVISYLFYRKEEKARYYLLSLVLFTLSLLSKVMAITLPAILLLCDYLLRRKFDKGIFIEKIPFLFFSLLFGIIAFFVQDSSAATGQKSSFSIFENLFAVSHVLTSFLSKLFVPINLSCLYPFFKATDLPWLRHLFHLLLILILLVMGLILNRYTRKIPFGLLFFFVTLLPVLPLKIVADRYTYIPSLGIFYMIGEGFSWILNWRARYSKIAKTFFLILFFSIISTLSFLSYQRSQVWRDSITLWNDVLKKYPNMLIAYNNRGTAYLDRGEYDRAISDYRQALRIKPDHPGACYVYHNLGAAYHHKREYDQAISNFSKALEKKPDYFLVYHHRGQTYTEKGEYDRAIADFTRAIEINPRYAEAYYNRGNIYLKQNLPDQAISDYTEAIEINPRLYLTYYNRGNAYFRRSLHDQAISDFNKAIEIYPGYAEAFTNRGAAYLAKGLYEQALSDFTRAIEINPKEVIAYYNRGYIRSRKGLYDQAISDFHQALSINPQYSEAYIRKALLCEKVGRIEEAIDAYQGFVQTAPPQYAKQIQFARRKIEELSLLGSEKFRR